MQFTNPRKQILGLNQIHTVKSKNKTCLNLVLNTNSFLLYIILSNDICDEYLRSSVIFGSFKIACIGDGEGLTLNGLYSWILSLGFSVFSSIKKKILYCLWVLQTPCLPGKLWRLKLLDACDNKSLMKVKK